MGRDYLDDLHPDALIRESSRLNALALERASTLLNENPRQTICPICRSAALSMFAIRGKLVVDRCGDCDFRFTNPVPSSEQIRLFYDSDAKKVENAIFEATRERRAAIYRQRVDFIRQFISRGKLLEVGGATGLFVTALREQAADFDVTVVELSADACERLRRRHADIRICNHDLAEHEGLYNCVVLWDVLAHIPDPVRVIRQIVSLLDSGGHLFLSTPNTAGFEHVLAGAEHPQIQPLHAMNYFGQKNLRHLLVQSGLVISQIETPNADIDVRFARQNLENGKVDREAIGSFLDANLRDDTFARTFADLLRRNCLGGNMVVAARKPGPLV
jgi:2-polyprenyl-3-methyl-5-hydroxy-6-metoxy-1,4-benzoquinol methylase